MELVLAGPAHQFRELVVAAVDHLGVESAEVKELSSKDL